MSSVLWRWGLWLAMATLSAWKAMELAAPTVQRSQKKSQRTIVDGFPGLIGNTPLVELPSLSRATGCTILVNWRV